MDSKSRDGSAIERTEIQSPEDLSGARARSVERAKPPGDVPGYSLERFLGAGAYGEVWEARNDNTRRRVAIKFFTRGDLDFAALGQEVDKLLKLANDRYVVQVLEVGWDAEPPYYVMDFLEFGSLEDLIRRSGTLSAVDALHQFREIAVALMHLHGRGVLHCDLKPANVLLDEDRHPRLADFGQARLRNEQNPALGTLFFMAPEQADLKAIPDARWDVYALGAIFYCMVTGAPPFRNDKTLSEIDSAGTLPSRLKAYRQAIANSPPPQDHRQADGVDSALASIIDQCLAVDPKKRLPSAQSVLESLRLRELNRQRRPLLALGLFGPAILLAILAYFAWVGYHEARRQSREALVQRAQESNRFAASYIAASVARSMDEYLIAIETAANDPALVEHMRQTLDDPQLAALLQTASAPPTSEDAADAKRAFIDHPHRQEFQTFVEAWGRDASRPPAASWITTDPYGTHLADWFAEADAETPVGGNFAHRPYYHGRAGDAPKGERPSTTIQPGETFVSPVFQSTATGTWKIMLTRPVMDGERFLGLVGVSIEAGGFLLDLRRRSEMGTNEPVPPQFATLLGERPVLHDFAVLQHPALNAIIDRQGKLPKALREEEIGFPATTIEELKREGVRPHADPIAALADEAELSEEEAAALEGEWIGGVSEVSLERRPGDSSSSARSKVRNNSGLAVLVQEKVDHIAQPIEDLTGELQAQARNAIIFVVVVIAAMWLYVMRMVRDVRRSFLSSIRGGRSGGSMGPSTPVPDTGAGGAGTGRAGETR